MFRLSRKIARMRSIENGRPGKSRRRRIVNIQPVASVPVRCISVDSLNHLYLCGKGFIPSHNTEAGNNWIGYVIHHAPGPMLAVQPTVELAKRFSRQRIDPLIAESPALRDRVKPQRSRDAGNTMLSKEFPAGLLVITGANSAVGLRSMPARYLFLDEVDAYPPSAGEEGDPVALAEARTRPFAWRSKIFLTSTPTIHGVSRIEREYEASDQRRFFVPCPHCGHDQALRFERLRWEKTKPETAHYACEACEGAIEERHKTAMMAAGRWRAAAAPADPGTIGFHLSALYSPVGWLSWTGIAPMWEAAQGTDEGRRSFQNGVLGETWIETGEAPDWQRLYDRREAWRIGTVPGGGLFLTAGADVQKDRIEVSIWAWGRGLTSWLVDHIVIAGGPERQASWGELTRLLGRTWPHAHGARLCTVAVATFKSETYRYLRLAAPTDEDIAAGATAPPGFIHLPRGAEAEWIKQLVAEQLVTVTTRRGFQKLEWQKLRERNEVLDWRVYARAAAWIAGADRWSGAKWRDLEDQLGPAPNQTDGHRAGDEPAPVTAGLLARAPRATGTRRSPWLAVDKGWWK